MESCFERSTIALTGLMQMIFTRKIGRKSGTLFSKISLYLPIARWLTLQQTLYNHLKNDSWKLQKKEYSITEDSFVNNSPPAASRSPLCSYRTIRNPQYGSCLQAHNTRALLAYSPKVFHLCIGRHIPADRCV